MKHAALYEDTAGCLFLTVGRKVQAGLEHGAPAAALDDMLAALADEWSYVEDNQGLVADYIERNARPIAVLNELGEMSKALPGAIGAKATRYLYGN